MSRAPKFGAKVETRFRHVAIIALLVLIGATGWQLAPTFASDTAAPTPAAPARLIPPGAPAPNAAASAEEIAARHLFGSAAHPVTVAPPVAKVQSNDRIQLRGVIFAADQDLARAILAFNNDQRSYRVGTRLKNGDKLTAIRPNSVILARHGKQYTLVLQQSKTRPDMPARFDRSTKNSKALALNTPPSAPATTRTTLQRLKAMRARLIRKVKASRAFRR